MSAHHTAIDYDDADAWDRVADLLNTFDVRPASRCGNVRCGPDWHWRLDLTDYDLWLAVAGKGTLLLGGETYQVRPGTLFWLRPGDDGLAMHDPSDPLTVIYVHFDFYRPGATQPTSVTADLLAQRHIPFTNHPRLESLLARIVRLNEIATVVGEVEAKALLNLALVEIYRQDALNRGSTNIQLDPRVSRVLHHIHRHPVERMSLQHAAKLADLSPDHFSRLFKTNTGMSFRQYVLNARLDRARHLLEESTLSITEIADALGYDDVFLFSRQCKARFGTAPSRLRRMRWDSTP